MKLSEMNTDQLAEALCEIADPISRICMDAEMNEKLKKLYADAESGMTAFEKMGRSVAIWLPALLKTRKEDTYKVLSVLLDKPVAEIAAQNGMQTISDARQVIDKDFLVFFRQSAATA